MGVKFSSSGWEGKGLGVEQQSGVCWETLSIDTGKHNVEFQCSLNSRRLIVPDVAIKIVTKEVTKRFVITGSML